MAAKRALIIGTRRSRLALRQAELVLEKLKSLCPHIEGFIKTIQTKGDSLWTKPLYEIGGKGLFVKEIEQALLKGEIDIAVHSMKDLPTEMPSGVTIAAVLEREDPRDAFLSFKVRSLSEAQALRIGTSSLRRRRQLELVLKGVEVVPLRGNVDTRIRKLKEGKVDGLILAYAGLKRLGYEGYVSEVIDLDLLTPPAGQGAIGIETREEEEILGLLSHLNDVKTYEEVMLERKIQSLIGGGCQVPVGINVRKEGPTYDICLFLSKDGRDLRITERLEARDLEAFLARISHFGSARDEILS